MNLNDIANENSVYRERERNNVRNTPYVMNLRQQNIFKQFRAFKALHVVFVNHLGAGKD